MNANASGSNDGSSWADAFTNLPDARLLGAFCPDVTEIWVAAGTYYPDEGGGQTDNDRTATFQLVGGIAIYGGYPTGGGTRDWEANPTILSGDIDGNDTNTDGNNINETWNDIQGSNSYHVVTGLSIDNTAVLDGFTITGGNANSNSSPNHVGGGIFNGSSNPTLTNITISGNYAADGGGMYNNSSSPVLTNVTIAGNQANWGGGMENDNSNPTLINVTISGNQASNSGGGLYVSGWTNTTAPGAQSVSPDAETPITSAISPDEACRASRWSSRSPSSSGRQ